MDLFYLFQRKRQNIKSTSGTRTAIPVTGIHLFHLLFIFLLCGFFSVYIYFIPFFFICQLIFCKKVDNCADLSLPNSIIFYCIDKVLPLWYNKFATQLNIIIKIRKLGMNFFTLVKKCILFFAYLFCVYRKLCRSNRSCAFFCA